MSVVSPVVSIVDPAEVVPAAIVVVSKVVELVSKLSVLVTMAMDSVVRAGVSVDESVVPVSTVELDIASLVASKEAVVLSPSVVNSFVVPPEVVVVNSSVVSTVDDVTSKGVVVVAGVPFGKIVGTSIRLQVTFHGQSHLCCS